MMRILRRLRLHHELSFRHRVKTTENNSKLEPSKRVFQFNVRCQQRNHKCKWKYLSPTRHYLRIFQKWIWNVSENDIYAEFRPKYDDLPKTQLKRALRELKSKNNNTDNNEISYVLNLIRRKYARKEDNKQPNHDEKITSNFWGYCKETFEKKMKSFDNSKFSKVLVLTLQAFPMW